MTTTRIEYKPHCQECAVFAEQHYHELIARDDIENLIDTYHAFGHSAEALGDLTSPNNDWSIQQVPQEGAPFLLYKGVLVGRLYAGCPYREMLRKLNA